MTLWRSLRAGVHAGGDGSIDWAAVERSSTAAVPPGSLDIDSPTREAYAEAVRDAGDRIRATAGLDVEVPEAIELLDRHHWIEVNVSTFRSVLAPLDDRRSALPGLTRRVNSSTMAGLLAFLATRVLGQYDPVLLADGDPRLVVVHPNLVRIGDELGVDPDRFRRWIVLHEVVHIAEFQAAPWLTGHLEDRITRILDAAVAGDLDRDAVGELNRIMTAVEGYAEWLMDRAFDRPDELRAAVDARRRGGGPLLWLVRRLTGLELKRRQYERGRAFFEAVAAASTSEHAGAVWRSPDAIPTESELEDPTTWLDRVEPDRAHSPE